MVLGRRCSEIRIVMMSLGSFASCLGLAAPAAAQSAAQPGAATNDEILVTATRRDETVRDVPFNIQAITGDALTKTGALNIADIARTIPGLSIADRGPLGGATLVLRGLRTGSEAGLAPTTTVYVDEVPMDLPYHSGPLDLKLVDIDRVEVLRGPQGTLFGGGAIGGTIRYISKKPDTKQVEGRVTGEVSGTDHGGTNYNVTGMINVPVNDWIAVRANIGQFDNAGFIDNVRLGRKDVNRDRTTSARIAVLIKPAPNLEIALTYNRQAAHYGDGNSVRESQRPDTVDFTYPGHADYTAQLANMTISYDFGWASLTSSSSYSNEHWDGSFDNTFYIRDSIYGSFLSPEDIPEFTVFATRHARSHAFTQEVRLVSKSDGPFNWIVGGYYNNTKSVENYQESVPIPFPGQAAFEQNILGARLADDKEYTYRDKKLTSQVAFFGELKYNLTAAWQASVGGRWFDDRGTGNFYSIDQWLGIDARDANGFARSTPLPGDISNGHYKETGTVWRFNTSYKFGKAGLIYATVAQGFRPGGFNLTTPNTGIPPAGRQFRSDNIVSYEIGGKFSLLNTRVYVSSDLFRINWSDIQTTVRTPLGFSYLGNAGKAVSQGLEIEAQARDVGLRGVSLNIGYSYTDAKLTQTIDHIGFDGEHMPLVPRHSLSLMADYATEIGQGIKIGANWLSTYSSNAYADFGPYKPVLDRTSGQFAKASLNPQYLPLDSYWLTNVSLRIEGGGWNARVFVDNLFNTRFKTYRDFIDAHSNFSGPDVFYTANRPRTIGVGIGKHF